MTDPRLQLIAEALAKHYLKERDLNPNNWCSYFPSTPNRPAQCIETYLQWQVRINMDRAKAVLDALISPSPSKSQDKGPSPDPSP